MSDAGSRLLRSARNTRAFARGETTEGFVVHVSAAVDVPAAGLKDTIAGQPIRGKVNYINPPKD